MTAPLRTTFSAVAAAAMIGVLSLAPATAGVAAVAGATQGASAKCPVDHHVYATARSAKRSGSSAKVQVVLGKKTCGLDGPGYKFVKHVTTLTVRKGAVVKVLKNIAKTNAPARIAASKLPRYVNRSEDKTDVNIFQVTGPHKNVKRFIQQFIS
jgi:hypothetical protein